MASSTNNNSNQYSLHNIDYFKKTLDISIQEIVSKYSELVNDYLKIILENSTGKNKSYKIFIITRGLDTITNVFTSILYYTKNLEITYFHTQKSFYFYVEFIGQISNDQNTFLQLNSRDATMYVYKKTLFEINPDYRKKMETQSKEENELFALLNDYIKIYQMICTKLVQNDAFWTTTDKTDYLNQYEQIGKKIANVKAEKENLNQLQLFVHKLNIKSKELNHFLDCILYFMKHVTKKKFNKNKIYLDEFEHYLNEPTPKFIHWLFNE